MAANARGAERSVSVAGSTNKPTLTLLQKRARRMYRYLATAFVAGLMLQVFIVGIALFVDGARWQLHQQLGHALTLLPVVMLVLALFGRMTTRTRLFSSVLIGLVVLPMVTASVGGWAGAFHPSERATADRHRLSTLWTDLGGSR